MTKRNALINLTLVFGLWFCLAFSCNSGTRKTTSTGGTTQPTTRTTGGGPPSEQDVRDAIKRAAKLRPEYRNIEVTFESPIRVGPPLESGAADMTFYDVRVDYTITKDDGEQSYITHYRGGTTRLFYERPLMSPDDYSKGEWTAKGYDGGQTTSGTAPLNR